MKDLLDKLSSYNIFNYLLPGVLFASMSKNIVGYDFIQENLLVGVFVYYFVGMVISRIGSLLIEPLLKKIRLVRFSEYDQFVRATKKDEKIDLLSEANNTYRTIVSMILLLMALRGYVALQLRYGWNESISTYLLCGLLTVLFVCAHRKQTNYIRQRVKVAAGLPDDQKEKK